MKEPTKAQVKKFWEGYGFKYGIRGNLKGWLYDNQLPYFKKLPAIDLNNLFKYAVDEADMLTFYPWEGKVNCMYSPKGNISKGRVGVGDTHALALFWALWEVKEKSNE